MEEEMSEARAEAIKATGFMGNTPEFDRFIKALDMYGLERETVARTDLLIQAQQLRATITKLEARSERLGKLEAAGVDNWEGYSSAFRDDEEDGS
jgi:hypothetical protein